MRKLNVYQSITPATKEIYELMLNTSNNPKKPILQWWDGLKWEDLTFNTDNIVTSINGKIGDVILEAIDVNAYTIEQINTFNEEQNIRIDALQGAIVPRGSIDNTTQEILADTSLLTDRMVELWNRQPQTGDSLVDLNGMDWYYSIDNGWYEIGQATIVPANNTNLGIVKGGNHVSINDGELTVIGGNATTLNGKLDTAFAEAYHTHTLDQILGLPQVAITGDYNDLLNKPDIIKTIKVDGVELIPDLDMSVNIVGISGLTDRVTILENATPYTGENAISVDTNNIISLKIKESDNVLSQDQNGLFSSILLVKDEENSLHYTLYGKDNAILGEINIPESQFLKSAIYDSATHILTFIFSTSDGDETVEVDLTDLIDVYVGDGQYINVDGVIISLDYIRLKESLDLEYAQLNHTHTWSSITDKPQFATVATTGDYNDLSNKPTSLPANGGDADTIDGFHASDFRKIYNFLGTVDFNTIITPGDYVVTSNVNAPTANATSWHLNVERTNNNIVTCVIQHAAYYNNTEPSMWWRKCYDGVNWTSWTRINDGGNADMVDGFHGNQIMAFKETFISNADANTILEVGIYGLHIGNGTNNTNFPKNNMYGIFLVTSNGTFTIQTATEYSTNLTWIRTYYNNTFTSWKNIADGGTANNAERLSNSRTLWGQPFDGTNNVSGSLSDVNSVLLTNGTVYGPNRIELYGATPFIDFHYNSSSADYTSRIIESESGTLSISGHLQIGNGLVLPYIGSTWLSMANRTSQIRALENNSTNNAHSLFKLNNSTGSAIAYGGLGTEIGFYGFLKSTIDSGTNNVDWATRWNVDNGVLRHTASLFVDGNVGIGTTNPWRKLHVNGDTQSDGWLYTTGNTGWANSTHGGGFMMQDSTFMRLYGNKRLYISNADQAENGEGSGAAALSVQGGISAGKTIWSNGTIRCEGGFSGGEYIDTAYGHFNCRRPSTLNNATCYAFVSSGVIAFGLGYNTSNQIVLGLGNTNKTITPWFTIGSDGVYQGSDERLKTDIKDVDTSLIKNIKFKQFTKGNKKKVGVIAQEVLPYMPDSVNISDDSEEMLFVDYNSILSAKCALYEQEIEELRKEILNIKELLSNGRTSNMGMIK